MSHEIIARIDAVASLVSLCEKYLHDLRTTVVALQESHETKVAAAPAHKTVAEMSESLNNRLSGVEDLQAANSSPLVNLHLWRKLLIGRKMPSHVTEHAILESCAERAVRLNISIHVITNDPRSVQFWASVLIGTTKNDEYVSKHVSYTLAKSSLFERVGKNAYKMSDEGSSYLNIVFEKLRCTR